MAKSDNPVNIQSRECAYDHNRKAFFYPLLILVTVILVIFVFQFVFYQQYFTVAAVTAILILLLSNTWFLLRQKSPVIAPRLIIVPVLAACVGIIPEYGMNGIVWVYPALILIYITLDRLAANIYSALLAFVVALLMMPEFDGHQIMQVVLSLLVISVGSDLLKLTVIRLERQLQTQATIDALTGAGNRRLMEQQITKTLQLMQRFEGRYNLLLINVDNFKKVNISYGYNQGDRVLKALVEIIRHSIRSIDSVYRVGGEEFAVLLQGGDVDNGQLVAEKLRQNISSMAYLPDGALTVSIGVAEMRVHETIDQVLKRVDDALSVAKKQGGNRVAKSD